MLNKILFILSTFICLISIIALASGNNISVSWVYPTTNLNVSQGSFFNVTVNITCLNNNCGAVNVTLDPITADQFNFTTCTATGRWGPSQSQCNTNYSGTSLDGLVSVGNGIQNWTVPATGTYSIEVAGASGGYGTTTYQGGNGSRMIGNFTLTEGTVIQILVGQQGGNVASYKAGGGGGGSFVTYSNNTPIIIAGGGSGGGGNSNPSAGQNGLNHTSGGNGSQGTYTGGLNGAGGVAGTGSSAGGGLLTSGNTSSCTSFPGPGLSFILNGSGGQGGTCAAGGGAGGFGGGSGGEWCCQGATGAGGGYSGGAGTASNGVSGGGGSFNGASSQSNTGGVNVGPGYVKISFLSSAKGGVVSTSSTATPFYTNVTNPYNLTLSEGESRIITWYVNATGTLSTFDFFVYANVTSNLSIGSRTSNLNITIKDTTLPVVNITYPTNTTYSTNVNSLNYTYSDLNRGSCWYSNSSGIWNSSSVSAGTNFTSLITFEGSNSITVYCNDSSGNIGSSSINFSRKTPRLLLELIYPTSNIEKTIYSFFDFSVNITCLNNNCGAVNVTLASGGASYNSCSEAYTSGNTQSGNYNICTNQTNCGEVYCNMDNGGYASIFTLNSALTLTDQSCIFSFSNDDHDSYIMWKDYTLKLATSNLDLTNGQNWYSWERNGSQNTTAGYLPNRPSNAGSNARPVSLPFANKVVWFDHQNTRVIWDSNVNVSFSSLGISGAGGMNTYSTNYYFITDGINKIHIGYSGGTAKVLTFNFNNNSITSESATVLNPVGGWYGTEEDAFGHVLWTVNGRVMYYNSSGNFILGGNLSSPNSNTTGYTVAQNASPSQPGLDFFGRVDTDGYLWFVDWGHDNGGYFNCGNDNFLGVGKTNIQLVSSINSGTIGGTISNRTTATPFYTTIINPYNLTLSEGESRIITWSVNTTGNIGSSYPIYSYANMSSELSVGNISNTWNVTVSNATSQAITCVNLTNSSTYENRISNGTGFYNVTQNIILCPGTYRINQDAFRFQENNVIIDCNNSALVGDGLPGSVAFEANSKQNVTIKNCAINNFYDSIVFSSVTGGRLANSTISGSSQYGIYISNSNSNILTNNNITNASVSYYLDASNNNNFTGNRIASSRQYGMTVKGRSSGNWIYNNYLNNSLNIKLDASDSNSWNIAKTSSINIIGGNYTAGNYWTNPTSSDFSDTCSDSNGDFICDSGYTIKNKNTDSLPLAKGDSTAPSISIINAANNSFVNGNLTIQSSASDNSGVSNVLFQYKNSTVSYTTLCNVTVPDPDTNSIYSCIWQTKFFSNYSEGYEIKATAYDGSGNLASEIVRYYIDRDIPYSTDLRVIYPSNQYYARNSQRIIFNINVSDSEESGSGINYSFIDLTLVNGSGNSTMIFSGGSKNTGLWSFWNISSLVNSTNGQKNVPVYASDNSLPSNLKVSDRFLLQVDNSAPTYDSLSATGPTYNNKEVTFSLNVYDNSLLRGYIFSSNITGSWLNDSEVSLSGTAKSVSVTKTLTTGNYSYNFYIMDNAGNVNSTATSNVEALGNLPIFSVALLNQTDNAILNYNNVNFSFSYYNGTANNCTLLIDGVQNGTLNSPTSDTQLSINTSVQEGTHSWNVQCYNSNAEEYVLGASRSFVVDTLYPSISINYPLNTTYSSLIRTINFSYTESNVYGCWYSFNEGITNSSLVDCDNITGISSSEGTNNWRVYIKDLANNINFTNVVFFSDINSPNATLINPPSATISINRSYNFTANVSDNLGLKNATLNIYNSTNNLVNSTTIVFVGEVLSSTIGVVVTLADGIYTWFYSLFDLAGNIFQTQNSTLTIDNVYSIFNNVSDNSGLISSGELALFNVTVLNTNGTVWLAINGTNYFATNYSANIYNVSIFGLKSGNYVYNWSSYGNGFAKNLNKSSNSNYIINSAANSSSIEVSWVYPTTNLNVSQGSFFNVTVNITCTNNNCGAVNVTLDPISADQFNFTTCTATGRTGPSQSQCNTNYSGTSLADLVTVGNGIQNWTVPATGTYSIEVAGASGGYGTTTYQGGNGSRIMGNVTLVQGTVLQILVGQQGGNVASYKAGGGGGGSFVVFSNNTPLIIAAGGSGGGGNTNPSAGQNGLNGTAGGNNSHGGFLGGINGAGGQATAGSSGGGGLLLSGNTSSCGYYPGPGLSFILNGSGGQGGTCAAGGGAGGFGGGSGGEWCCQGATGAGGGYSGGAGTISTGVSGGGGSFNGLSQQSNAAGTNVGPGYVKINFLSSAKGGVIPMNPSSTPFYTNVTNPYNLTLSEGESRIITWYVNATGSIDTFNFFVYANVTSNLSIGSRTSNLNITIKDTTLPVVNITYPTNTTYSTNVNLLNYTYSDLNRGSCWYSNSSGIWNSSSVSAGTNFTSLITFEGSNSITVYCNDSSGNIGSSSVNFSRKTPRLLLDVIYPTGNITSNQGSFFNVTVNITCLNNNCGAVNVTLDPITANQFNFTTCTATGRTGPSQSQCNTNYSGTSLEGLVNVTDGIQYWTVPTTGTYLIEVWGAAGGRGGNTYAGNNLGGRGARMKGEFELTEGTKLQIIVGQKGTNDNNYGGGGGGGSFVANGTNYTVATPIIIAGGAGGGGYVGQNNSNALTFTYGLNATSPTGQYSSGTAGHSGAGGSGGSYGGSGGGFLTSGTGGQSSAKGSGFKQGGAGGSGAAGGAGGFGGGGGGYGGAGAGGGYSGGGGGGWSYAGWGGAGGSYNIGLNQDNSPAENSAEGLVSISFVGSAKGGVVSTSPTATPFYTNVTNPYNLTLSEGESRIITWYVNATGTINSAFTFFVYSNVTSNPAVGNISNTWNVTISNGTIVDSVTAAFYNIQDNNRSNLGSISLFNVTVLNTNGTVWLELNNVNITSTNISIYNYTASYNLSTNGTYSYRWFAYSNGTSKALSSSDTKQYTVIVADLTPPAINIISPLNITYLTTSINFSVISSENSSWCGYSLDGISNITIPVFNSTHFNITNTSISQGSHNVIFSCNDTSGNMNSTEKRYFVVDTVAPDLSFISPLNTTYVSKTLVINITNNSDARSIWFNRGLGNETYSIPLTKTFSEGNNVILAYANDSAGNLNFTTLTFFIDSLQPTITIISPQEKTHTTSIIRFNITTNEDAFCWLGLNSTNNYTLESTNNRNFNQTIVLPDNTYSINYYCNDSLNNLASVNRVFGVKTVPPQISLNTPSSNRKYNTNTIQFNYTPMASDGIDTCEIWGDWAGGWHINYSSSSIDTDIDNYFTQNITDGSYKWNVWCNNTLGQRDWSTQGNTTFTIDRTPPYISFISPVNTSYNQSIVSLELTNNSDVSSIWWFNGSINSTYDYPTDYNLRDGYYTYTAYANDSAGNLNSTTISFYVDTTHPTFSNYWSDNSTIYKNGTGRFSVELTNTNGTVFLIINGQTIQATNSTLRIYNASYTFSSNNTYEYYWTSFSNGTSRLEGISLNQYYTVNNSDSTPPNATLLLPSNGSFTNSSVVNLTASLSDNYIGVKNATFNVYNSSNNLINSTRIYYEASGVLTSSVGIIFYLVDGSYKWFVNLFDFEGNQYSTDNRTFTVDLTPPAITITSPQNNSNSSSVNVVINYSVSDLNLDSCWFSYDSSDSTILDSCNSVDSVLWETGRHNVTIWANDTSGNINRTSINFLTDASAPDITTNYPENDYIGANLSISNLEFNCSSTDDYALKNISLYITDSRNSSFSLNQTTQISGISNSTVWSLNLSAGNYTWNCLGYDSLGNSDWGVSARNVILSFSDSDEDGISDSSDNLLGTENSIAKTGISTLNVTISGNSTFGSYNGTHEVAFFDSSDKIINFTYNFSSSSLDLSKIRVVKSDNYILVNLTNQLQMDRYKTIYFEDNDFSDLCVKDEEISSISEMSTSCTGVSETNFSSCLGNSTGVTLNSITCVDEGDTIIVSDLRHSAIRGVPRTQSQPTTEESSSSGGSGSSGGGSGTSQFICKSNNDCSDNQYCFQNQCYAKECTSNDQCTDGKFCWDFRCVKIFDVKIIDIDSTVNSNDFISFSYFVKGVANISNDVIIDFWLEKDGKKVTSGRDTIFIGSFEEKTEKAKLFVPRNIPSGNYDLYISATFEKYTATAHRQVEINNDLRVSNLERALFYLLPILFGIIIILTFVIFRLEKKKLEEVFEYEQEWILTHRLILGLLFLSIAFFFTVLILNFLGILNIVYLVEYFDILKSVVSPYIPRILILTATIVCIYLITKHKRRIHREKYGEQVVLKKKRRNIVEHHLKKIRLSLIQRNLRNKVKVLEKKGYDTDIISKNNPQRDKLNEWKKKGYDMDIISKNNPQRDKLNEWKKKGYDTDSLER